MEEDWATFGRLVGLLITLTNKVYLLFISLQIIQIITKTHKMLDQKRDRKT